MFFLFCLGISCKLNTFWLGAYDIKNNIPILRWVYWIRFDVNLVILINAKFRLSFCIKFDNLMNLIQYVESNFMRNLNGRTFVEFILPWNFSSTKIRLDTTWIRSYKPTLIFVLYLVSLTRPLVLSTSLSTPSILFSRSCLSESYCVLVTNSLVLGILVSIALALLTNWLYTVFLTTSLSNTLLISLLRTLGTLLIYLLLFLTSQICFWYQCRCTNACCPFQIGRHCIVRWSNRTFVFPPDCSYGSGKY